MNFSDVILNNLSIHLVGNKNQNQLPIFSKKEHKITNGISENLTGYFLSPFQKVFKYEKFTHPSSLKYNTCYNIIQRLFSGEADFQSLAIELAKYLYDCSANHFIKTGEFYVTYLKNIHSGNKILEGIGLFKSESKEKYLKIYENNKVFDLQLEEGINLKKIDKGALILNEYKSSGYKILTIDNTNKSEEAQYWKNDFLKVEQINDEYYQTENYISLCKDFIVNELPKNEDITRPEQIDLLNKTADYFNSQETFDINDYKKRVLTKRELQEKLVEFTSTYEFYNEVSLKPSFEISATAFKKGVRNFKSVLKLDKNFHVYIHGDKKLIERGFDKHTGKNYYKLYFDEES